MELLTVEPTTKVLRSTSSGKVTTAYNQSLVAASLYVDYVFLDTDERRRMAQNPHEYLIEQLQFTGDESVGSSSNKIKLNFNHPVKELIWVVQPDENVDYCASLECSQTLYSVLGAQPFNYTDAIDALPNAIHSFGGPESVAGTSQSFITADGLFHDAGAVDVTANNWWHTNPGAPVVPQQEYRDYNGPNLGFGANATNTPVVGGGNLNPRCWRSWCWCCPC